MACNRLDKGALQTAYDARRSVLEEPAEETHR